MDICDIISVRGTLAAACCLLLSATAGGAALEEEPLKLLPNGGFSFGYANRDRGAAYHEARGTPDKIVRGRFGSRSPANGRIEETLYTAGPRGYRPRGPNVARKYDLSQVRRGPIGRPGDPFFDPNEDPSYEFGFKTPTYQRQESADRNAKVTGRYSYVDDVGERHDVQYTAGKETGFHVGSLYPDSNPDSPDYRYFRGPLHKADKKTRGKTSVQRGTDGSYRFITGGPDQRRTESKDPFGNVRGSYTYLDDKGKQHTTHYIAGAGIGYRVLKKSEEPHYPGFYPYRPFYPPLAGSTNIGGPGLSGGLGGSFPSTPGILPTDAAFSSGLDDGKDFLTDDVFGAAASGHVKPTKFNNGNKNKDGEKGGAGGGNLFVGGAGGGSGAVGSTGSAGGSGSAANSGAGDDDSDDIFGGSGEFGSTGPTAAAGGGKPGRPGGRPGSRPGGIFTGAGGGSKKPASGAAGGSYKPSGGGFDEDDDNIFGTDAGSLGSASTTSSTSGSKKPGSGVSGAGQGAAAGGGAGQTAGGTQTTGEGSGGGGISRPGSTASSAGTSIRPGSSSARPGSALGKPTSASIGASPRPGSTTSSFGDDEDDLFGPSSNVQVGIKKPSTTASAAVGGTSDQDSDDDGIFGDLGGGGSNEKAPTPARPSTSARPFQSSKPNGGMNQYLPTPTAGSPSRPSSTSATSSLTSTPSFPVTPAQQGFGISAVPFPGQHVQHGTIFRNVGNSFIGFPPGVAVRAHVQSIDLFPIGSTNPSPGEAMEKGNPR